MNWVEHWSRPYFVFLPRYHFFQLSQANSSYSSYISMDVSDFYVDDIFFLQASNEDEQNMQEF